MKNEWTEQDLRRFVESSRPVFQDVSLTQVDEDADRCWQDDGLMVDYELRGGQVIRPQPGQEIYSVLVVRKRAA